MTCPHCSAYRPVKVKGMCMACYMRKRRADRAPDKRRRKNGQSLIELLALPDTSWLNPILEKIDASGDCHEWRGGKTAGGYGIVTVADRNVLVHRLIHAIHGGDPLAQVVMHKCDNPGCCNPAHLAAGSYQDNMRDMHAKGRWDKGRSGEHLRDRRRHPRARPVETPLGVFPSMALAAEAHGVSYGTMKNWMKRSDSGFRRI